MQVTHVRLSINYDWENYERPRFNLHCSHAFCKYHIDSPKYLSGNSQKIF